MTAQCAWHFQQGKRCTRDGAVSLLATRRVYCRRHFRMVTARPSKQL